MNSIFKSIIIIIVSFLFASCSDEFVNEKLDISGVGSSAIIISPEWNISDYQFKCEDVGNADFKVMSKPDWLTIDSNSGKFTDSIATIRCLANQESRFSKTGVYIDQMLIKTENKNYAVPLYYIKEGNPTIQVTRTLEINYSNYNSQIEISNPGDGILLWDIVSLPDWLKINMSQLNQMSFIIGQGASAKLPFIFDFQSASQNNLNGTIVLKSNDKYYPLVEIAVSANIGTPSLQFLNGQLDFGSIETTKSTNIYNHGNGILIWNFEGLPDWLSVSTSNGVLPPYSGSTEISFTCNRSILKPGLTSASFYLKSNDPNKPSTEVHVSVRIPGSVSNIKEIEGNIIDVTFDKKTNTLYYVTEQPNKLIAYDVTSKSIMHEVLLSKAPTCLAIKEDFTQALVGHGGLMSAVDLTNFSVRKTYELSYTVYDVEWAKEGWYCFSKANSTISSLYWLNADTDETFETTTNNMLGTAELKKIPNQSYIIASRTEVSPTGIFVFEIDSKSLKSYTHESIGKVWFLKGGDLLINNYSYVIKTSAITEITGSQIYGPSSIGELKYGEYRAPSWWTDYSESTHSIWSIFSYYTQTYYPPVNSTIYQFEDNDFKLVKTYTYDNMYQPSAQVAAYEVEARFVFANSSGSELTVLRKGKNNNSWSAEFISVQ